jgi:murein DD-endopeptidase MepM/ murein hydrolase activator NlpD
MRTTESFPSGGVIVALFVLLIGPPAFSQTFDGMQMPVTGVSAYTGCPTEVPANFAYSTVWAGAYSGMAAERCEGSGRHPGVDIPLPEATPVLAAAKGIVAEIERFGRQGGVELGSASRHPA